MRDKYGAATPWMRDTVTISSSSRRRLLALPPLPTLPGHDGTERDAGTERDVGTEQDAGTEWDAGSWGGGLPHAGGGRELLAAGFDWDAAVAILDDARLGGNQGLVNQIASTLLLEMEEQRPSDAAVRRAQVLP